MEFGGLLSTVLLKFRIATFFVTPLCLWAIVATYLFSFLW